jgi:hypothetical protein
VRLKLFFLFLVILVVRWGWGEVRNFRLWSNAFDEPEVVSILGAVTNQGSFSPPQIKENPVPQVGIYWLIIPLPKTTSEIIAKETGAEISAVSLLTLQVRMLFPGNLEMGVKLVPMELAKGVQICGLEIKYNLAWPGSFSTAFLANFSLLKTDWNWGTNSFSLKGVVSGQFSFLTPYLGMGMGYTRPKLETFIPARVATVIDYSMILGVKATILTHWELTVQGEVNQRNFSLGIGGSYSF